MICGRRDPNRAQLLAVTRANSQFRECLDIARKVLQGELSDPTNGADHYYADYIATPDWARGENMIANIGVHLFYQLV